VHEIKSLPQHVKAIEGREVTGLFSVFGNVDSWGDVITPGAFAKTIAERSAKVLHLWQHDFSSPPTAIVKSLREIGRDELPPGVLAAYPQALGGAEVVREYLPTQRGEEALAAIKAGSPLEMSFGYDPVKYDFGELDGRQVRYLRELKLYETSDVLWGANSATLASKALLAAILERRGLDEREALACKGLLTQLDAVLGGDDLTRELKEGRVLSKRNRGRLESAITEIQAVLADADADGEPDKSTPTQPERKDPPAAPTEPPEGHSDLTVLLESVKSLDDLVAGTELLNEFRAFGRTLEGATQWT
jgi:phage head maturation protease